MSVPIKTQIGENDLAHDDIYDLISDFDPETNNFVESSQNRHLKKKNGFVTNVKIKVLMFSMNDYLIN